jgi:hypothetical protein
VPYNPALVLQSSQILTRTTTPPLTSLPTSVAERLYKTPEGVRDVEQLKLQLQQSESVSRSVRQVLSKVSKSIAIKNSRAAELQLQNERLQHQLNQLKPTLPKKRVQRDPNYRFSDIEAIRAVQVAAAEAADQIAAKTARKLAKKTVTRPATFDYSSMCTEWQL